MLLFKINNHIILTSLLFVALLLGETFLSLDFVWRYSTIDFTSSTEFSQKAVLLSPENALACSESASKGLTRLSWVLCTPSVLCGTFWGEGVGYLVKNKDKFF